MNIEACIISAQLGMFKNMPITFKNCLKKTTNSKMANYSYSIMHS